MDKAEFVQKFGEPPLQGFTIAEVPSKYKRFDVFFGEDGKLSSLNFFFDSDDFEHMMDAVREKYPKLRCQNSSVTNLYGARLTQTECSLDDQTGKLTLSRFVNDVNTSSLSLYSSKMLKEMGSRQVKRNKDL